MNFDILSDDIAHKSSIYYLKVSSVLIVFFAMVLTLAVLYYLTPYTVLFSTVSVAAVFVVMIINYITLGHLFDDIVTSAF